MELTQTDILREFLYLYLRKAEEEISHCDIDLVRAWYKTSGTMFRVPLDKLKLRK